ncbi:hypothetical protein [Microbacterium sp. bgisy203]|uniref:hypothetical protein n=1 Tax=Microbacterium sp. bgisy203 TaxID=3413799 RepID=UPI003D72B326
MSTPDQPETPQLTRRQLRELRNTASNPIITPEEAEAAATAAPVVAPLPRAAEPVVVEEAPAAAAVDLDAPALTRREARQQERLRTASVPVIEAVPSGDGAEGDVPASADADEAAQGEDAGAPALVAGLPGSEAETETETEVEAEADAEAEAEAQVEAEQAAKELADAQSEAPDVETTLDEVTNGTSDASDEAEPEEISAEDVPAEEAPAEEASADEESAERPVVAPTFGAGVLKGEGVEIELPASFDQLLTRGSATTGSVGASNALILSQTPDTGAFTSPIAATGEVLITGTYKLPDSFGSTGTSRGSSDGKEIDAILVDGELPPASSPTPIAASSAISTIKSAEDIIKPPAPEKGSRLMVVLGITAGALAIALIGVLIVGLVTGALG